MAAEEHPTCRFNITRSAAIDYERYVVSEGGRRLPRFRSTPSRPHVRLSNAALLNLPDPAGLPRATSGTPPESFGYMSGMDEQVNLRVAFRWHEAGDVVIDGQGKLAFPRFSSGPGIYRIAINELEGPARLYVGEADNLQRRFAHYRNPGPSQRTNQRINALLIGVLEAGGMVMISTATEARLTTHDYDDAALDLASKASRLLAENAALVQATMSGVYGIENL